MSIQVEEAVVIEYVDTDDGKTVQAAIPRSDIQKAYDKLGEAISLLCEVHALLQMPEDPECNEFSLTAGVVGARGDCCMARVRLRADHGAKDETMTPERQQESIKVRDDMNDMARKLAELTPNSKSLN